MHMQGPEIKQYLLLPLKPNEVQRSVGQQRGKTTAVHPKP